MLRQGTLEALNMDRQKKKRKYHPVTRLIAFLLYRAKFKEPTRYYYVHYLHISKTYDASIAIKKEYSFSFNEKEDKRHIDAPTYRQACRFLGLEKISVNDRVLSELLTKKLNYV